MSTQRPHIVIADLNEDYALRLEDKFLRMMRNNIELDVITDSAFFYNYFSRPVHVDVALVSENLADSDLDNQDITSLYVLTEEAPPSNEGGVHISYVYKYTSLSHVFNQTMGAYAHLVRSSSSRSAPKAIVFFSPVGGTGKTTLAAGVATCLQENGSKVLYIDAEYQQEVGHLFASVGRLSNKAAMSLAGESGNPYVKVKPYISHDVVDVVPPLSANIMMFGITFDTFTALVEHAMRSADYDYVVVDTDSVFNGEKLDLVQMADVIVVPTNQSLNSCKKVKGFLESLDRSGRGKCHVVCNAYVADRDDSFRLLPNGLQTVEATIPYSPEILTSSAENLGSLADFVAVTYLVR